MRYSFPCGSPEGTWACVLQAVPTGRSAGRGHRVLSQVCLLLQFPGSAGRAARLDVVFSTLQRRLLGSAVTSYDTHVYFYSTWSAGWLIRRGWVWHSRVVTHCSCHFACISLALSCFSAVKSFSFMVSGHERFPLIFSVVRSTIPSWLLIYKLHFSYWLSAFLLAREGCS